MVTIHIREPKPLWQEDDEELDENVRKKLEV
jgi:hypothetical protein